MKSYYAPTNGNDRENLSMVVKTLKPEERSMVNVLAAHGAIFLQKYVTKESGLSRLKTQSSRCVSERGIVQVQKYGNRN